MKWRLIMSIIKVKPTALTIIQKLNMSLLSTIFIGAALFSTSANAVASSEDSDTQSSRSSHVQYNDNSQKATIDRYDKSTNTAQQAAIVTLNELPVGNKQRKTREQIKAERIGKLNSKSSPANTSMQSAGYSNYVEFGIYSASSRLFEDFDYDGFYQTFSVTFDADVYGQYTGERARVFADLYLSRDGGPWELYFTTDTFTIVDDLSNDEFEVLTTLDLGYKTGHYDVLVDLYEEGYSDIVATISSEDVAGLYALPLESSDRDEYEVYLPEVIISAGSLSFYGLLVLVGVICFREGYLKQ